MPIDVDERVLERLDVRVFLQRAPTEVRAAGLEIGAKAAPDVTEG